MSRLVAVALDDMSAAHLTAALEAHRRWCRTQGYTMPAALADLQNLASSGQKRPSLASAAGPPDDPGVTATPLLKTFDEAGESLRLSGRQVRRLVDQGDLPAVSVGARSRRVHVHDLTAYAERLRTAAAERRAS